MLKVKITSVGNSLGVLLPKEVLTKMKVSKGDALYLVEGEDGYTLTPYLTQQDFEAQINAAENIMECNRNTLHELAK